MPHPNDPKLRSFIAVDSSSDFPIQNLPYGVFSAKDGLAPRVGVAIGSYVLDLWGLAQDCRIDVVEPAVFAAPTLNPFMALGPKVWTSTRARISELLREDHPELRDNQELRRRALVPMRDVRLHLPITVSGYTQQWELLRSLPAVQENAAAVLAEMGPDPAQFPNEKHLASWSGLCPGNNRSAGRSKSSHTNQGNRWLRAALTESAWAVSRMKDGHLREKFWRIASRGEPKRSRPIAVVAIGHDLLKLAYFVLQRGTPYEEKRGSPISEEQKQRLIRHHVRRLGKLGIRLHSSQLSAATTQCRNQPIAVNR